MLRLRIHVRSKAQCCVQVHDLVTVSPTLSYNIHNLVNFHTISTKHYDFVNKEFGHMSVKTGVILCINKQVNKQNCCLIFALRRGCRHILTLKEGTPPPMKTYVCVCTHDIKPGMFTEMAMKEPWVCIYAPMMYD